MWKEIAMFLCKVKIIWVLINLSM